MKVFVSCDLEGVAGISDWQQCRAGGDDYPLGRALLLGEVNAAIDGALEAGATQVLVNDSHGGMRNLDPAQLSGRARYLSGRHKPLYMMQGLDASFAAAVFVGYHAAIATPGVLSHTYNPRAITGVRLNGTTCGESGLNALVAQAYGVPIAVVTGDQYVGSEAEPFCPGIEAIAVKESVSRFAADSLHPEVARERIRAGVCVALRRVGHLAPPGIGLPARLEVDLASPDMAEQATWLEGVGRTGERSVQSLDDDPLRLFRRFVTLVYLTRSLVES